ncbi:MAG: alpha/beta hydrolase-fold protein [Gemmatales bacterium]|nr:alpha/beta hydrolase-fold protein [Gemmatales bacterium]MDW7995623.1 alpha/beta hydrolase-fold protein [Gemmatales bacterium]
MPALLPTRQSRAVISVRTAISGYLRPLAKSCQVLNGIYGKIIRDGRPVRKTTRTGTASLLACAGLVLVVTSAWQESAFAPPAWACWSVRQVPALQGTLLDYTDRHGIDRRIYSSALKRRQSLYVYLPPDYDAEQAYPLAIYLHAGMQDVSSFLGVVSILDRLVACGDLPPLLVAAPDGSLCPGQFGSFFINGPAGNYQDWVVQDVYSFLTERFRLRSEPQAHVLVGASMGGFGAFNIALKHPDRFQTVAGIMPALNLRWIGACGSYFADFHPQLWGWREVMAAPYEPVGKFGPWGLVKVRAYEVIYPAFGSGPQALQRIRQENPIELLLNSKLSGSDLSIYIAYAGRDEFNLDAQAESFIYVARQRQLDLTVDYHPNGRHNQTTALQMLPGLVKWLRQRLQPYVPRKQRS